MIVLALAGAVLVGNDFRFGSLPFYLSKPLGRWHYVLGKCLAVAVFVNLMTTFSRWSCGSSTACSMMLDLPVHDLAPRPRHPRLRGRADRLSEPAAGRDGELAAADGADGHGLDDALRIRPRPARNVRTARSGVDVTGGSSTCGTMHRSSATGAWGCPRRRRVSRRRMKRPSSLGAVSLACLIYLNRRIRAVEVV